MNAGLCARLLLLRFLCLFVANDVAKSAKTMRFALRHFELSRRDRASLRIRRCDWPIAHLLVRALFLIDEVHQRCKARRGSQPCANRQSACPTKSRASAD